MFLRKVLGVAAIASVVMAGHARADLIDLTTPGGGTAIIDFHNYESFTNQLNIGSQNYGTFQVTAITVNGNNVFAPSSGAYLVGVFNGITVASVSGSAPNINVGNTGGTFNIWQVSSAQLGTVGQTIGTLFAQGTGGYAAAGGGCAIAMLCYNGITNVGGTDYLNFNLVPGADAAGDTLAATLTTNSFPPTGSANGYGDITGGAGATQFTTGNYLTSVGTFADVTFSDEFCPNGSSGRCIPAIGNWDDQSFDPATAQVSAPEPLTLSLLGVGLIGLGISRRRR